MFELKTVDGVFSFNPDTHTYFLNEEKLDNNTSILESVGITDFSMVPPERLEQARLRGYAVHAAIQYLEDGVLDWNRLHPLVADYLKQWQSFKEKSKFHPVIVERPMYSKSMKVATTPDLIGLFPDRRYGIVEIKSVREDENDTAPVEAARIQTAGQLLIYDEFERKSSLTPAGIPTNPDRNCLVLSPKGYKLHGPFLQTETHTAVFQSAVWIHRYKNQMKNGGTR